MKMYLKALKDIFKNYHLYSIPILISEVIFHLKYSGSFNKIKYLNSNFLSDSIPCSYFFLKKIKKFIIKNDIKYLCDLGSGYGKILYYFGILNNYKVDGVEFEKEIYIESLKLKNNNIKIFNKDIINFNFIENQYELFIINDPLKKDEDLKKLILEIIKNYKKIFLIFINLNPEKLNTVTRILKIKDSLIISKSRNILFCSID